MPGWMDIPLPPPRSLCSDGFLAPHPPQVTLLVCVFLATGLLGDHAPPHAHTKFPHPSSLNSICQKSVGPATSASPVPQHLASRVMRWHISDQGLPWEKRDKRRRQTCLFVSTCPPPDSDPLPIFSHSPFQDLSGQLSP